MKPAIIIMAVALLSLCNAQGRLGETEQQVEARYGKAKVSDKTNGRFVSRGYVYHGFEITVSFENGISRGESYHKPPGEQLLETDINALLNANSGGGRWQRVPDSSADSLVLVIYRGGGHRIAMHNAVAHSLLVTSEDFVSRMNAQHSQALQGF